MDFSPTFTTVASYLAPAFANQNPALAVFDTANENPLAASLGILSPTGLAGINSSGSFTSPADFSTGNPIGSNSPLGGLNACVGAGNSYLKCLGMGFGAGLSAIFGGATSGTVEGLTGVSIGRIGLVAVGLVVLLGAFIILGRTRVEKT